MPLTGLHVDVSTGRAEREEQSFETARAYVGGRGLGVHLLLQRRVHDVDPLSPASPLIIAPGPLTGSAAPATGRYSISARSPLTGTVFDGNSGGGLGIALRRCGFDYLTVDGACEKPSYVLVDQAGATLRPAGELWGLDAPAALSRLRGLYGHCEAAVIGRAGENGVLFASIVNDRGRQIGRGGLGAIMGAKRLKGIVLAPSEGELPLPADPEGFESAVREFEELVRSNPATAQQLPRFGTSVLVHLLNRSGVMPTRNFRESRSSWPRRSAVSRCVPRPGGRGARARAARSAARETWRAPPVAGAGPSTRASGRWERPVGSAISPRSSPPTTPATRRASTPSPWARRSPVPWSSRSSACFRAARDSVRPTPLSH